MWASTRVDTAAVSPAAVSATRGGGGAGVIGPQVGFVFGYEHSSVCAWLINQFNY